MGHLSAPRHPRRTLVNYEGRRAGGTELTGATVSPGLTMTSTLAEGRATIVMYIYAWRWE